MRAETTRCRRLTGLHCELAARAKEDLPGVVSVNLVKSFVFVHFLDYSMANVNWITSFRVPRLYTNAGPAFQCFSDHS